MSIATTNKCSDPDCKKKITTTTGYSCGMHKLSHLCSYCAELHRAAYHTPTKPLPLDIPYGKAMKYLEHIVNAHNSNRLDELHSTIEEVGDLLFPKITV